MAPLRGPWRFFFFFFFFFLPGGLAAAGGLWRAMACCVCSMTKDVALARGGGKPGSSLLDHEAMTAVTGAIDLLELEGPTLGRPIVDKVHGSIFHSMKELRPAGTSVWILFIFDPRRQAILLLGGDKAGSWNTGTTRTFRLPNGDTRAG